MTDADLRIENQRLRALLEDRQFVRNLADYNRGHLSHANWLNERMAGLRLFETPAPTSRAS